MMTAKGSLGMRKVLLVQPSLEPVGGGTAVAVWMIEALKREHDISVLTWAPFEIEPINNFYGTSLSASDFKVYWIPKVLRRLADLFPHTRGRVKILLLMYRCKRMRHDYDVIISASGLADFGRRGIQYIHFPWFHSQYRELEPPLSLSRSRAFWNAIMNRCRPWRLLSGYSLERMRMNLTLVNSDWTGSKVTDSYGIGTTTVYPPVAGNFPSIPWRERENGFVCIGRISPEKRLGRVIAILGAVRSQGEDIHLHLVGNPCNGPDQGNYYEQIRQRVQENASWVYHHENLPREELVRLVSTHKYGIHRMVDEHFGIAIAEMVRGGCIVFVPRSGGQTEILGQEDRLLYETNEEAIAKILRVMRNPSEQCALRRYLNPRKGLFSAERFMRKMQEIVRKF